MHFKLYQWCLHFRGSFVIVIGTRESVLIREVSLFQSVLLRGLPLYIHVCVCKTLEMVPFIKRLPRLNVCPIIMIIINNSHLLVLIIMKFKILILIVIDWFLLVPFCSEFTKQQDCYDAKEFNTITES